MTVKHEGFSINIRLTANNETHLYEMPATNPLLVKRAKRSTDLT